MKKYILFILFAASVSLQVNASSYLFRVQVGTFSREASPKDIRKVPNLKKYVLPESVYCFFSGGYYKSYKGAIQRLEKVKGLGFDKAVVRVFKNQRLQTFRSANKIFEDKEMEWLSDTKIKNINQQVYSIGRSHTLKNRMLLYNEFRFPSQYKLADKKEETKAEEEKKENKVEKKEEAKELEVKKEKKKLNLGGLFKKEKKKKAEEKKEAVAKVEPKKEEVKEVKKEEVASKEPEKKEEEISEEMIQELETAMNEEVVEEILGDNDTTEVPNEEIVGGEVIFKVYLGSNRKGSKPLRNIDKLPEIVYSYEKKQLVMYTVGYYETSVEAAPNVAHYRKSGFPHARLVGLYKGIIVSERVAKAIEAAGKK